MNDIPQLINKLNETYRLRKEAIYRYSKLLEIVLTTVKPLFKADTDVTYNLTRYWNIKLKHDTIHIDSIYIPCPVDIYISILYQYSEEILKNTNENTYELLAQLIKSVKSIYPIFTATTKTITLNKEIYSFKEKKVIKVNRIAIIDNKLKLVLQKDDGNNNNNDGDNNNNDNNNNDNNNNKKEIITVNDISEYDFTAIEDELIELLNKRIEINNKAYQIIKDATKPLADIVLPYILAEKLGGSNEQ